ncbi:TPA: hypothetical protein PXM86_002676 [Yersinia enterocolitica]|nr:hypothetical protein [Yersinia enterocolitica]
MRFPYQRLSYMFDALQSETLPQEELAKRFAVSNSLNMLGINARGRTCFKEALQSFVFPTFYHLSFLVALQESL